MGFVRLVVFGFIVLSIVYLSLSIYSRSIRREKLEDEWDAQKPDGMSREEFVAKGVADYNSGLRPKLLLLVYVIPTAFVAVVVYLTNIN